MPRVDFYLVDDPGERAWLRLACRLTEKAYSQSHRVCIAVDSEAEAKTLDDLLWTYREGSFIPHAIAGPDPAEDPVIITAGAPPAEMTDILVNLRQAVPVEFARFARVVEPLNGDAARRAQGRVRFKHYRDQGVTPESHNLSGGHED